MAKKRDSWASRATFIFAAIGSAVGLGNAWRFPGLAAMHGGGTFLLVYILAMFILGWPLLMMEISIGRKMQHGAPGAFRGLNKKAEFVGWAAVANAFVIVTYYAVVLAWILVMIVKSFKLGGLTSQEAGGIFFGEALQYQPISSGAGAFDIPGGLFVALLIAWIAIYLCIRKGAHSAGKVVPFTVIIPVVLLIILAINGMVKDFGNASGAGLKQFFIPDFSKLGNSGLWIDAFGQVFYSLSIMMAIMIAYGSFVNKKSDIVKDTLIIAISDMAISVLAGIVLFTTLSGTGMLESYLANPSGGIGTAFVVYPQAMVMLSNSAAFNSFIAFLFYMTLLTLAIDSAFSIVEGVATSISDKFKLDPRKTRLTTCLCAALVSVIYITKGGLEWLDIVDKWANSFSLILVGIIECIVVGWFFKTSKVRDELNRTATSIKIKSGYDWIIKIVAPLLLGGLFIWNLIDTIKSYGGEGGGYGGYPIWAQVIAGWLVFIAVFVIGIVLQIVTNHSKKFAMLEKDYKAWDDMHDEEIEELVNEGVEESEAEAIVLNSAVEEAPNGESDAVAKEVSNDTDAQ